MPNLAYHWEFFAKKPAGYRDSISITAMGGLYFLASSNCSCTYRFPKYRIPVAIYGSAILFGLSHLSNFGWHGESFTATIAQVIGVMGSAFIWAELYLYTGKLWLPMIYHFLMDYISDLQSGWNSAGWSWNGEITDYIYTVLIVGVPLLFSIWMLFGKRRQVMEDNADLILNLNGRQSMI
ncbi:immunity protein [Lactobacillus crispatus]|uniref:CPBP family intramembrane glutamic endopeptidase n=2 Tax=Lactobacillus crispatus TaxID=47770 RepID=UPI001EB578A1|nr:CPBP family intramembrane glutamic endopeptidase [Lactobacillus crispatus]MBI1700000.1 immunity protein [Lactobacillus crispatus]MBI1721779.1 immunity protein [Lactobacillus crispatus]